MVRFSCFQAHNHFHKHKRTVTEAMHKTLEDASQSGALNRGTESLIFSKDDGVIFNRNRDHATDSSLTERDCRSDEIESKCNSDSDDAFHKNMPIKKSLSLGSGLNRKEEILDLVGSENDTDQIKLSDGAGGGSGIVELYGSNNHHGLGMSDQYQEPMPSDSVHVHYDFAQDESISSLGDPQALEKEFTEEDDIRLSGGGDSVEHAPYTPPAIMRSSSLPSMASPDQVSRSVLPHSRSSEDLNGLHSRKKGIIHEVERELPHQKEHSSLNNHEHNDEYLVDDPYETYNCVGSAKEWIIPVPEGMEKNLKGETTFHRWDDVPAKDFRLKRIEEWVSGLEHCSSLEESNDILSSVDHELPKAKDSLEELTEVKLEAKTSPGMEAAKRYISSLNASATAAQLTNLGLVVIPFISAFASLKALNLSGNSFVRITAGALPRGLHILNLSRNNISTIEGLRDLTRLRVLDLSYNRILRIGHGLAGCSSLKELYLAGNKISEVEGLHRLLKLNVLDLCFNKISTTKCLGQLASNYNCLQALSLEGNPAQKNVGDEQLKKYVQSLLPHLTYYNRQSIKVGKDASDRAARLSIGAQQIDRGLRVEAKSSRKGGIVAQKVSSSSSRKSQVVSSQKMVKSSRHVRLPPSGTSKGHQVTELVGSKVVMSLMNNLSSIRRSRSEGTLGALQ